MEPEEMAFYGLEIITAVTGSWFLVTSIKHPASSIQHPLKYLWVGRRALKG